MKKIKKVGVLGCGLMGSGVAETAARAGYETVVREVSQELVEKGVDKIRGSLGKAVERGKLEAVGARRGGRPPLGDGRPRRPRRLRHRGRGDRREPRREAQDLRRPRRGGEARGDLRQQHLVAHHHPDRHVHQAAGPVRGAPLLQPGAGDEAGRGGAHPADLATRPSTPPSTSPARSARSRSPAATTRASWSTACSSPTCSTPSAPSRRGWGASRTSTRGCSSAAATRWGRSPCSTSWGSTPPTTSPTSCSTSTARSATPRPPPQADGHRRPSRQEERPRLLRVRQEVGGRRSPY